MRPSSPDSRAAGAQAAILARLWGALQREPIPGVARRVVEGATLRVELVDGTVLTADAATARPFAIPPERFAVTVSGAGTMSGAGTLSGGQAFTSPCDLVRAIAAPLGRHAARLAAELDNSVANLALAREATASQRDDSPPDSLVHFEQSIVDGHPLHPCARTRMGLTADEVLAYAPEHHPTVRLRRIVVPEHRWHGVNHPPLLLMHPWQHDRLADEQPWLSRVVEEVPARPLMSLRTLALGNGEHVKTALNVQMTSAVRTVSPESIHNGHHLSRLVAGIAVPGFDILPDIGGGAAIVDGEPDRRLAMVRRVMPALTPGEVVLPLAALGTAGDAGAGTPPTVARLVHSGYGGDPYALVTGLAGTLLPPVFALLERGIALEAHGQNVLGVLRDGRLTRVLYRDFGGVRVSPDRLRRHGIEPPPLLGDVPSDDLQVLRTKVLASAVATVLGDVIATLHRWGLDEQRAWDGVAVVARGLPHADGLFAATLPVKAMTAMRLAERPVADLWCARPNPRAGLL